MELIRVPLTGEPRRVTSDNGVRAVAPGVIGVDVTPRVVDGEDTTLVQVLLDDDDPAFDRSLLDAPLVAELAGEDDIVVAREPFDHDQFRRRLLAEREAGESIARGVLVLNDGEPPPVYVRIAFLPLAITATAGSTLIVRRSTVAELTDGVEEAFAAGTLTDNERRAILLAIEQRHPGEP